MAYSTDLASISMAQFADTLLTVELLPSRRVLGDHIAEIVPRLTAEGVHNLDQLKRLLAKKRSYPDIAARLGVDTDYLTLLNREVNSYVSKPVPLRKLGILTQGELTVLASHGIESTKDLYEGCTRREDRSELADAANIPLSRLEHALRLADLIRINGVGPMFAEFLLDAGIKGPQDLLGRHAQQIAADYAAAADDGAAALRVADVEYVQRYCEGLSTDVEW